MDHSYFRDKVSAYNDRELPAQELAMLGEHIASCTECQKLLAEYERLDQLVADRIELSGSEQYWEESAQKIEERLGFVEKTEITPIAKTSWDKSLAWKLTAVAASVTVLVFIGINKDEIFKRSVPEPEQKQEIRENLQMDSVEDLKKSTDSVDEKRETRTLPQPPVKTAGGQTQEKITSPEPQPLQPVAPVATEERSKVKKINIVEDEQGHDAKTVQEPVLQRERLVAPSVSSPIIDSESRAAAPTALSTPKLEQTSRDMAASTTEVESIFVQAKNELADWRKLRDSLSQVLSSAKPSMVQKYAITGYQKSEKSRKAAASNLTAPESQLELEKRYLEACYQIALLTNDTEEYQSARQSLEKVAGEVGSANATLAGEYLTRLKSDRPTPPEK